MIRLTIILTVGIIVTMLIFGTEDPSLQTEAIEQDVLPDVPVVVVEKEEPTPIETVVQDVAQQITEPEAIVEPEPETEVARLDSLDLNKISANDGLLVVEASDAPPDAFPPVETSVANVDVSKLLVVTGTRVNLRAGPSTGQAIVTQLGRGAKAELLTNTPDGWVQIRHVDSGRIGYMSADFLTPAEPG